jgi:hypothetical protein
MKMTETEWLGCQDPGQMVRYLVHNGGSERKLRLFGCACARRVWDLLSDECCREAVEVAERFADGQASPADLDAAKQASGIALERNGLAGVTGPRYCAMGTAWSTTRDPGSAAMYPLWVFTDAEDREWQVSMLRDIFGNPFYKIDCTQSPLSPEVIGLARSVYENGVFDQLPQLADALEQVGCSEAEILEHCRHQREHVRGCWVIDTVLGKE